MKDKYLCVEEVGLIFVCCEAFSIKAIFKRSLGDTTKLIQLVS